MASSSGRCVSLACYRHTLSTSPPSSNILTNVGSGQCFHLIKILKLQLEASRCSLSHDTSHQPHGYKLFQLPREVDTATLKTLREFLPHLISRTSSWRIQNHSFLTASFSGFPRTPVRYLSVLYKDFITLQSLAFTLSFLDRFRDMSKTLYIVTFGV
ncbi:hypothetical protein BDP81DRAFT_14313 [Colletotrichum phormii]|uniref:Uncharacterized protein n=1 Tax=Colletotrichum phormii TaxID=359342 RepID=A0AAJ0EP27_9PEZI|nr:uncharacterized protein BDP81DRAFT_14313 [Colletotrichum phormii]KAK1656043.1 hypothetical protein BDP81DRAFT_14313 [Colletotrichum phormii]